MTIVGRHFGFEPLADRATELLTWFLNTTAWERGPLPKKFEFS